MKKLSSFIILAALASACNQGPETLPATDAAAAPPTAGVSSRSPEKEVLKPDQVKINDVLAVELSTSALVAALGEPGQIETGVIECGDYFETGRSEPGKTVVYRYGNHTRYLVYNQRAALGVIDFRDGRFSARLNGTLVDRTTTLEQIANVYPQAVKAASGQATREDQFVVVRVGMGPRVDSAWMLKFVDGKLAQLEYFIAC